MKSLTHQWEHVVTTAAPYRCPFSWFKQWEQEPGCIDHPAGQSAPTSLRGPILLMDAIPGAVPEQ
jgi:hypothetical protein